MASVVVPTRRWTSACAEILEQASAEDEVIFVCDTANDPVAMRDPAGADIIVAGEPTASSGKAHALACGLERATHDRLICTDDDFDHGEDWLASMKQLGERHGTVAAVPLFVSEDPRWWLIEPAFVVLGSLPMYRWGGVWGGGVSFDRRKLDFDGFLHDLRRTVSDDALLWEYLGEVTTTPELVSMVPVDGRPKIVLDRLTRFVRTFAFYVERGTFLALVGSLVVVLVSLLAPVLSALVLTIAVLLVYRHLGLDRRTYLLAYPAFVFAPLWIALGLIRREFDWGGRRYRWTGKFEVRVLGESRG